MPHTRGSDVGGLQFPFCESLRTKSIRLVVTNYVTGMSNSANQGEDALANLSIEKTDAGTITGHVRIRSKTQGIALSLGDRITLGGCLFR